MVNAGAQSGRENARTETVGLQATVPDRSCTFIACKAIKMRPSCEFSKDEALPCEDNCECMCMRNIDTHTERHTASNTLAMIIIGNCQVLLQHIYSLSLKLLRDPAMMKRDDGLPGSSKLALHV